MAAKTVKEEAGTDKAPALLRVRFISLWSSDRGCYPRGTEAELPLDVAESLFLEGVAEVV